LNKSFSLDPIAQSQSIFVFLSQHRQQLNDGSSIHQSLLPLQHQLLVQASLFALDMRAIELIIL
jgi:hypothetical protein